MYALNLDGVTMGFLITKSNAFVMLGATRALMSCGWNGRDMINLKTVGMVFLATGCPALGTCV